MDCDINTSKYRALGFRISGVLFFFSIPRKKTFGQSGFYGMGWAEETHLQLVCQVRVDFSQEEGDAKPKLRTDSPSM